jgi:hypothetical protein
MIVLSSANCSFNAKMSGSAVTARKAGKKKPQQVPAECI